MSLQGELFHIPIHCLDFWRLLKEAREAPESQRQSRWFFFDMHMVECPRCERFFSLPVDREEE